jgi:protein-S-isoprenylcysteine O-methyltransferase
MASRGRERKSLVVLPLIYTNAAAAAVFIAACLIWNVPEAASMLSQMARVARGNSEVQDRGSLAILLGLLWLGLALSFLLAAVVPAAALSWHRTYLFLLAVVLILCGVGLRWYAIITLGRYFTRDVAVSADQPVVQTGPYRFIRHPSYTGTFLTMLGVGLAVTNWASLVALLTCTFAGHLYRVHVEEEALSRTIGRSYLEYCRHTRRFIPFVY